MKIGAINSYYRNNSSRNFKGLWAKTTRLTDFEGVLSLMKVTKTSYYHPFANENAADIKKTVLDNTSAYIEDNDNRPRYIINECKICTTLPFTQEQYVNYKNCGPNSRLTPTNKAINKQVQKLYVNNAEASEQTSAVNPYVNGKIKYKVN